MAEQRTFVFALIYIILFSALLVTIPTDLQGLGQTANELTPINPNVLTDYADYAEFDKTDFGGVIGFYYLYPAVDPLGGYFWECDYYVATESFSVAAQVRYFGLWFGALSYCNFISDNGTNYGANIAFDDIDNDAEDGAVRYSLTFADTGSDGGDFIFFWNTTEYSGSSDAWDSSELYLFHGVGFATDTNIVTLLVGLLFLQLPDCPVLINVLLATPVWACVVFLIWFIIKESLPFV